MGNKLSRPFFYRPTAQTLTINNDIIWTEEKLQNICSAASFIYLSSVYNVTRYQNPLNNFERRFQLIFGTEECTTQLKETVFNLIEDNGKKRFLKQAIYNRWLINVGSFIYNKLNKKLENRDHTTENVFKALQKILKVSFKVEIKIGDRHNIIEFTRSALNDNNKLYLYIKTTSENFNVKFSLPNDKLTLPMLKDEIICFTATGVKYLIAKLGFYEAVSLGDKEKAGKYANALGEIPGTIFGAGLDYETGFKAFTSLSGKISEWAIKKFAKSGYKDKAQNLLKYFNNFSIESKVYRSIFIKTILEICIVFQKQIVEIRLIDCGWDMYLKLLAIEFVGRITSFINKPNTFRTFDVKNQNDCNKFITFLVKAAMQGKSKHSLLAELIPNKVQLFDATKPGFKIEELGDDWRSTDMLSEVGIFYEDKFYKPRNSNNVELYGFRYLAEFEEFDEDSGINKSYTYLNINYDQLGPLNNVYTLKLTDYKDQWLGNNENLHDICGSEIYNEVDRQVIIDNDKLLSLDTNEVSHDTNESVHRLIEMHNQILGANSLITNLPIQFDKPRCRPLFAGREAVMQNLYESVCELEPTTQDIRKYITIITGLGGIGKSELVSQFISNYDYEFEQNIIWINAESQTSIQNSFLRLAEKLKVTESAQQAAVLGLDKRNLVANIYERLSSVSYLIVFDNFGEKEENDDNLEMLSNYLPTKILNTPKQRIIITSRLYEISWERSYNVIKLGCLNVVDSANFLLKSCHVQIEDSDNNKISRENDAKELAQELQGLPLILQQAVAYINAKIEEPSIDGLNYDIGDYLNDWRNKSELFQDLLDKYPQNDLSLPYKKTIWTTWKMTIMRIERDAKALGILQCMAFLNPEKVPSNWFVNIMNDSGEPGNLYQIDLCKSALHLLEKYSMISLHRQRRKPTELSIHGIVQEVIRHNLDSDKKILIIYECFKVLQNVASVGFDSVANELEIISNLETVFKNHSLDFDIFWLILNDFGEFILERVKTLNDLDYTYFCLQFCETITDTIIKGYHNDLDNMPEWLLEILNIMELTQLKFIFKLGWRKLCFSNEDYVSVLHNRTSELQNKLLNGTDDACNLMEILNQLEKQANSKDTSCNNNAKDARTLISYYELHFITLYLLLPLLLTNENDLKTALQLFEYLTQKFKKSLTKFPKLEMHIYNCIGYCWFKLNEPLAAIIALKRSIGISVQLSNIDNEIKLIMDSIDLLETEFVNKKLDIDNSLRKLVFGDQSDNVENVMEFGQRILGFLQEDKGIDNPAENYLMEIYVCKVKRLTNRKRI